ncbi:MAG: hypothetical protein HY860_01395, partial [Chlamydiales bacterium]|nr:hypothetical protein [Chlamydiales bacterium]
MATTLSAANLAPISSFTASIQPTNWEETLVFEAVNPTNSECTRTTYQIALVALAVFVTLITCGTALILVHRLYHVYGDCQTKIDDEIVITSPEQMTVFIRQETDNVLTKVQKIIDAGINVVISRKGINSFAQERLAKAGIISI